MRRRLIGSMQNRISYSVAVAVSSETFQNDEFFHFFFFSKLCLFSLGERRSRVRVRAGSESYEIHKIFLKLLELPRRSFFGPYGGKSDVLNPFLMVPRASFDFCSKCSNCLGTLFSDPLGGNLTPRIHF